MDEQAFKHLLDEALSPFREDMQGLKEDVSTLKTSVLSIE